MPPTPQQTFEIIAWNTQGAKWDALWTHYISGYANTIPTFGLVTESGWGPWCRSDFVYTKSNIYPLDSFLRYHDVNCMTAMPGATFCGGVNNRNWKAFWVPWQNDVTKQVNTRCSLGGAVKNANGYHINTAGTFDFGASLRPGLVFHVEKAGIHGLTIILVHLISGYPQGALEELNDAIGKMAGLVPESTPAIVVGDMNIDLLTTTITLPPKWSIARTGVATHQSGSELDWALVYEPRPHMLDITPAVVDQYKSLQAGTGNNGADHSVVRYSVSFRI